MKNLIKLLITLSFLLSLSTGAFAPTNNLEGYYKLNSGSGTTALDSAGEDNNGEISGASWISTFDDYGLSFDGSNDYLKTSGFSQLGQTDHPYTIYTWVRIDSNEENGNIIHMSGGSDGTNWCGPPLHIDNGNIQAWSWNGDAVTASGPDLNKNEWHQVATSWDSGRGLRLYVNGDRVAQTDQSTYDASGSSNYIWAAYTPNSCNNDAGWFSGDIDRLRVFNDSLSENDIQKLYDKDSNHPPSPPFNPSPENNSGDIIKSTTITVNVTDKDSDPTRVCFYNSNNSKKIGCDYGSVNGTASVLWKDLESNSTYRWKAVANDTRAAEINGTWTFETGNEDITDSNWSYSKSIYFKETSNSPVKNYPVKVKFDTAKLISESKMQNDCSDIRFYDTELSKQLDYWIERGCNTNETLIWVELSQISPDQQKEIKIYYGNPESKSISNGYSTFEFFDRFALERLDESLWDTDGYGQYEGIEYNINGQNLEVFSDGSYRILRAKTVFNSTSNITSETLYKKNYADKWHQNYFAEPQATDKNRFGIREEEGSEGFRIQTYKDGTTKNSEIFADFNHGNWQISRIQKNKTTFEGEILSTDYKSRGSFTNSSKAWKDENWTWVTWKHEPEKSYYDWVRIRKSGIKVNTSIGDKILELCDRKGPKRQCIVNETKDLDSEIYSINSVFISKRSASMQSLSGKTTLEVSNSSFISGSWHGSFYLNTSNPVLEPGASFKPEKGRIILGR